MNLSDINALFRKTDAARDQRRLDDKQWDTELVKTGRVFARDAVEQAGGTYRYKAPAEEDAQFPLQRRKRSRMAKANANRQRRKGQRAYVRQQLAEERAVDDLRQFFDIYDLKVQASNSIWNRADRAPFKRAEAFVDGGGAANIDEAYTQLRALAGR